MKHLEAILACLLIAHMRELPRNNRDYFSTLYTYIEIKGMGHYPIIHVKIITIIGEVDGENILVERPTIVEVC